MKQLIRWASGGQTPLADVDPIFRRRVKSEPFGKTALDLPVAGTLRQRISGGRPMKQGTIDLERRILTLFKLAFRQGRSDIAEHLLRALEALDQRPTVLD
ncbi:hypothetical protein [Mesorhizobium comanense]|jgi:hypothetical protein|uniref:hypothetical protein n=1 Tax=Mesorhizobium comanense TaxID=2502215 RepID=UPI0010F5D6A8|nr:hypothetical protein [Mesorhizobium comanense]